MCVCRVHRDNLVEVVESVSVPFNCLVGLGSFMHIINVLGRKFYTLAQWKNGFFKPLLPLVRNTNHVVNFSLLGQELFVSQGLFEDSVGFLVVFCEEVRFCEVDKQVWVGLVELLCLFQIILGLEVLLLIEVELGATLKKLDVILLQFTSFCQVAQRRLEVSLQLVYYSHLKARKSKMMSTLSQGLFKASFGLTVATDLCLRDSKVVPTKTIIFLKFCALFKVDNRLRLVSFVV